MGLKPVEKHIFKNADEIKTAVDQGKPVFWSTVFYRVIKDRIGQYLIVFDLNGPQENAIGLTWQDGVNLNGKPEDFFTI